MAETSLSTLFVMGGWAMWPLLVFSVLTITLIAERAISILSLNLQLAKLAEKIIVLIKDGRVTEATELCRTSPKNNLAAPILLSGLESIELSENRMEKIIESQINKKLNMLERGFDLLTALGSIAPITGFLGTVSGMITAFRDIANAANVNAQLVAGGIFEALITTAYGLGISILAITAYNIFTHIIDRFAANIEGAANEMLTEIAAYKLKSIEEL